MRSGIPYRVYGGLKFYDRKEVKDVVAYLRALVNPDDDISLLRIINEPRRGHRREHHRQAARLRPGAAAAPVRGGDGLHAGRAGRPGRPGGGRGSPRCWKN